MFLALARKYFSTEKPPIYAFVLYDEHKMLTSGYPKISVRGIPSLNNHRIPISAITVF